MVQPASMEWASQLSMAAEDTAVGSYTEAYEFQSESLTGTNEIVDTNGITGDRSHKSERTRFGLNVVGGGISFNPSPAMLVNLLPRILGGNASGTTFPLANTLPAFDILVDRVAQRWVYGGCKVDSARFSGSAGGLLGLDVGVKGVTYEKSATSFPSIADPTDPPYMFEDVVLTLVGSSRQFMSFELMINNALMVRHSGSRDAATVMPTDRLVTFRATTPWTSDEADLHGQALAGSQATIVATNGNYSLTFTLATLQFPDRGPVVRQRGGEIVYEIEGVARMSGSTKELVVVNDSTP